MELNETHQHFSSYFTTTNATATAAASATTTTAAPSPVNGLFSPTTASSATDTAGMVYPHSVVPATEATAPARKKRGRPRKYGTPEQALAAKRSASASSNSKERREIRVGASPSSSPPSYSSLKKSNLSSLGNAGQGFTPHVISVAAGEDVALKLMHFMQESKREICILSASGSISNISLLQPATSGGSITYEGRFEIISLTGSYIRTALGGRTGGLSACLSNTDGELVGGGVTGPLKAAGPVQIIVGTFLLDSKKDINAGVRGDASMLAPVGGTSTTSMGFRSPVDSSGRNPVGMSDDYRGIGRNSFMIQHPGIHEAPSRPMVWSTSSDGRSNMGYDLTGHGGNQSPENGDYD